MLEIKLLNIIGTSETWDGGYNFIEFQIAESIDNQGLSIKNTPSILVETYSSAKFLTSFDLTMDEHLFTYASSFIDDKCYGTLHLHLPPHLRLGVITSNLTLVKGNDDYTITKLALVYNESNV